MYRQMDRLMFGLTDECMDGMLKAIECWENWVGKAPIRFFILEGMNTTCCSPIHNHSKQIDELKTGNFAICWIVCVTKVMIYTIYREKQFLVIMLFICLTNKVIA